MLNIQKYVCNPLQENTYVVSDETGECVFIDCGAFYDNERMQIAEYVMANGLAPVRLLCTHGHFDHCMGNDFIYDQYGLKPEVSPKDEYLMSSMPQQAMDFLGMGYERDVPTVGRYFTEGEIITFGNHQFKILETPGHTPGSVSFYCEAEKVVFTGDTLFQMSIGRTDFEGGSYADMRNSLLNVIAKLPTDTIVYSGHGGKTNIGAELASNPYLR